jgi:outer membrane receptor for ferrienterochelin and colicins
MKKHINYLILFFLLQSTHAFTHAQSGTIRGIVYELDEKQKKVPVPFANVYWLHTTAGVITDDDGHYTLPLHENSKQIVVSHVSYQPDTILVPGGKKNLDILLNPARSLAEVEVTQRVGGSYISAIQPIKTEVITTAGLQRLACCNLSESFENSATIDVGYSDAVTGAKHISMLGLAGKYSQLLAENVPTTRGLASTYGLSYIPGTWMEAIQISKGTSSVINGYESTTGQINIEFLKPETSDPLFLNLYQNDKLRSEINLASAKSLNENWHTMIMAHGSLDNHKIDENDDGFLDSPLSRQINLYNRWKYDKPDVMESQIGFKFLDEQRRSGQYFYPFSLNGEPDEPYRTGIDTRSMNAYTKTGFMIPGKPGQSLGNIVSVNHHDQKSFYGRNRYDGRQNTLYANIIFQSYFGNTNHTYNTGVSYLLDDYREVYNDSLFTRMESVPGVFFQYTYNYLDQFNLILGGRTDYHNLHGMLITPRMHFRYVMNDYFTLRGSAGKGYRSANVFAENSGLLASSRTIIPGNNLRMEEAWNYGLNFTSKFHYGIQREITWSVDFYRTDFVNQVVVDLDQDAGFAYFYNLEGESYSNSFQTDLIVKPLTGLELTGAFRVNDVRVTQDQGLVEKPLVSKYKGLFTLSYATKFDIWQFDITNQFNGPSRIPFTGNNPVDYQRGDYSPWYYILHAQITRRFKHIDVYLGSENITGYTQDNPIIAADNPFSPHFDASMIWGPLMGRMIYAGIRWKIE